MKKKSLCFYFKELDGIGWKMQQINSQLKMVEGKKKKEFKIKRLVTEGL